MNRETLEALRLREIVEAVLATEDALREAQEAEAEGTITAVSYAYIHADVDDLARTIVIRTGNRFFGGDRDEVRRGRIGSWSIMWNRNDIGIVTGEDFMPEDLRAWLLEHTRPEADEDCGEQEGSERYDEYDDEYDDEYEEYGWRDTYPW